MELTDDEWVVAETLLKLWKPVVWWGFPFSWGCKRRRSAEVVHPSLLRSSASVTTSPSANTPAAARPTDPIGMEKEMVVVKQETSSPSTPLSFSPSTDSSDENPNRPKKKLSLHKRKEESREITLTHANEILKTEIKKAKHFRKLESNIFLKARKLEIIKGTKKKKENSSQLNTVTPIPIPVIDECKSESRKEHCGTVTETDIPCACPFYQLPKNENEEGTRFLFDLNASPPMEKESSPPQCSDTSNLHLFDGVSFRRSMAAQARQRRMQICRTKKNK